MPGAPLFQIRANATPRHIIRRFACSVGWVVWWLPGQAHAHDVGGLILLSGRVSLFFAALFYGALTWRVMRNQRFRWVFMSGHCPFMFAPFLLAWWPWPSSEVELGWVLLANLVACLPLLIALASTKRWLPAALLLCLGSWAIPPVLALVAAMLLGVLGLALRPFGLVD